MSTVSILMPIKGPAEWIEETLASVRLQRHTDYELLCVIDGQDPELEMRLKGEPKVRVFTNQVSRGAAVARQVALSHAQGKYIATLDSDDIWSFDHLAVQVQVLESNPDLVAVGSSAVLIDQDGITIGARKAPGGDRSRALLFRNQIINSSCVFRHDSAIEVGGYDPNVRVVEDYDLWLRLATVGKISNSPHLNIYYRRHRNQVSKNSISIESRKAILMSKKSLSRSLGFPFLVVRLVDRLARQEGIKSCVARQERI